MLNISIQYAQGCHIAWVSVAEVARRGDAYKSMGRRLLPHLHAESCPSPLLFSTFLGGSVTLTEVKRKVKGVPQSQVTANPGHQEEGKKKREKKTDRNKQAHDKQTHEKHTNQLSVRQARRPQMLKKKKQKKKKKKKKKQKKNEKHKDKTQGNT